MADIETDDDIIATLQHITESIAVDYADEAIARKIAQAVARRFQWHFGKQMQYIPKPNDRIVDLTGRNMSIWEEYNQAKRKGLSNINHLARKYGLSTNQIYCIIRSFRAPEH